MERDEHGSAIYGLGFLILTDVRRREEGKSVGLRVGGEKRGWSEDVSICLSGESSSVEGSWAMWSGWCIESALMGEREGHPVIVCRQDLLGSSFLAPSILGSLILEQHDDLADFLLPSSKLTLLIP